MGIIDLFMGLTTKQKLTVMRQIRDSINSDIMHLNNGDIHKCKFKLFTKDPEPKEEI